MLYIQSCSHVSVNHYSSPSHGCWSSTIEVCCWLPTGGERTWLAENTSSEPSRRKEKVSAAASVVAVRVVSTVHPQARHVSWCALCRESLQGRLDYANSKIDDIMDSADRPQEVIMNTCVQVVLGVKLNATVFRWCSHAISLTFIPEFLFLCTWKLQSFLLQGSQWWRSGDTPWQVLACCMEITDAIRSGDPPNFITHIPVQQVRHNQSKQN